MASTNLTDPTESAITPSFPISLEAQIITHLQLLDSRLGPLRVRLLQLARQVEASEPELGSSPKNVISVRWATAAGHSSDR